MSTQQQQREIAATARALETLAASMGECAGDPEFVAINAFRASLAVLSLRGQADRLSVTSAEQARVRAIVERAAAMVDERLIARGTDAMRDAFDFLFPESRLEDLNVARSVALTIFLSALAVRS